MGKAKAKAGSGDAAARNSRIRSGFGARLLTLATARGLTRGQLAEQAGVSYDEVLKLVRGDRMPSFSTLHALADTLELPIPELIGDGDG